jgi:GH24 family phage-related lysozyme (muramidase)|tara:strand:- start:157 stop:603 length:447 start_codon:yes stop_codon:yes gene_type:complete
MDIQKLRQEIEADEGNVNEIYLDHLGLPTFGIGHLVRDTDPEHGQPVGTPVSEERVNICFDNDIQGTITDCKNLFDNFDDLPEEAQLILCNMMYNLGYTRLSKFSKLRGSISIMDFTESANQMYDSKWRTQVPNRAERLINRMKALGA